MARKSKSRKLVDVQARYDAAGTGRRLRGWNPSSSGPNKAIANLATIRNRSRDSIRNEWSGASGVRSWTSNLVGTGIVPRPTTKSAALKEKLTELWSDWVRYADADGVLDFYGLQALGVRSWFAGGEYFVRIRPRRIEDGLAVPMQIQLIESEQVPQLDADTWPGMPAGNMIRQGIELDRIGRRVAYWMYKSHPGDLAPMTVNPQDISRVPARFVCHVYDPQRPGQLRGVSEMASVITRLRGVADFDDNVLERQRLANLFAMFVIKPMPSGYDDQLSGGALQYGMSGEPVAALEPGISQELLPGEDVRFSEPPDAGANYADFMRQQYLGVASGQGLPYELLSGDIKDVSDRTLRVVLNEFHRLCEQKQWLIIIPQMCQPIRDVWADMAVLSGVLSQADGIEAKKVRWSPQAFAYVHPVQDVQSKQLEVEAGFRSRASVISERGEDPEEVDAERAEDKERAIKLGIEMEPVDPADDPMQKAKVDEAQSGAKKTKAEIRLLEMTAEDNRAKAIAQSDHLRAEAEKARAQADLFIAQAKEHESNAAVSDARIQLEKAEVDARLADMNLAQARAAKESEARIEALESEANIARDEKDARMVAFAEAEIFAKQQRELVLAAETARAATAATELAAAKVGLAELEGE